MLIGGRGKEGRGEDGEGVVGVWGVESKFSPAAGATFICLAAFKHIPGMILMRRHEFTVHGVSSSKQTAVPFSTYILGARLVARARPGWLGKGREAVGLVWERRKEEGKVRCR